MKVKAKNLLFYGNKRRKAGEIFDLVEVKGMALDAKTGKMKPVVYSPQQQFSEDSMERVDAAGMMPTNQAKGSPQSQESEGAAAPTGNKKVI
jgi:hypothetical protein